ncbi:methylated-DNA--[protein]-cysteine S-methyltransferase [Actinokineospora diospyrosa]|uniref:Methylated-DNA-[protein]-cysteine S-methyltransferase n=1 Tax=Actinokineospora diospyrosa TaxID=103728 RepID=A0ABT1I842_9PSEU|nr:methylated-DNA--[protein]-cysteine S-methyltransferase [Actinokineospora diospyrosa]MCP2268790.1 methylated-DNA-[protein]-cysteine S-methyltransferase [Actinokineospora diospyrosa]
MTGEDIHDPLALRLGGLAVAPPRDLTGALFGDWTRVDGPVGELLVAFTDIGVSYIRTADSVGDDDERFRERFRTLFQRPLRRTTDAPAGLRQAVRGKGANRVPVDLRVLTDFERDVLTATRDIPTGQTRPYAWVARAIGRPKAVRAVGTALGNNPVPLLIPCHRVTRSDGTLGQYVFGADTKERLLRSEDTDVDQLMDLARSHIAYQATDGVVCYPTCTRVRSAANPRGFRTLAAAEAAGNRPCELCAPAG